MTEIATMLSAARLGWQILAKAPWLSGWLLRRAFPASLCKSQFQIEFLGSHSSFELLPVRPSHALANLEMRVYNPLPFAVELEAHRLQASIDSNTLLDAVLNTRHIIPAAGFGRIALPEITLTQQQSKWIQNLTHEYTRVQFILSWRCKSAIHDWEISGTYEFPVLVRMDIGKLGQEVGT